MLIARCVPKTEPRMIATIDRIVNKQIGIANLFLRYHPPLINVMESFINNTVRRM
jgi:hypothetical protein